jgi:hypothetical protein
MTVLCIISGFMYCVLAIYLKMLKSVSYGILLLFHLTGHIECMCVVRRGIIVYLEYLRVCPVVGIVSPHLLHRKRVCLPPWTQRRDNTLCG